MDVFRAAQTDQLSGLDDRATLGASVSETAESYAIFGSYYIPLVHPQVLTLGTTIGYSSYDASTFGVTAMDFNGNNLFIDESILWSPSFFNGDGWRLEMETGLKWENVKAFNSFSATMRMSQCLLRESDFRCKPMVTTGWAIPSCPSVETC